MNVPADSSGPLRPAALRQQPEVVRKVLEEDQFYEYKHRKHFGRRKLSPALTLLLWALRVYVVLMLILVLIQVIRALRGG